MYFLQCPCNLRWRRCRWWGENLHGRVLHDSLIIPTLTIFSFILHSLLFSASCSWNLDFFSSHENERSRLSSYDDEEQEHIMLPSLLKIINNVARCYFWFRQQHHQGLKGRVVIVRGFSLRIRPSDFVVTIMMKKGPSHYYLVTRTMLNKPSKRNAR